MTGHIAGLWRHPIKSHGRETLDSVVLTAGQTMPWDRVWAVAHERSSADGHAWAPCANFSIGAKAPGLMAIDARLDQTTRTVHLTHPDRPPLSVRPDDAPDELIAWAAPLMPADRLASARVVRVPGRGMTDTAYASVSIGNLASHRAVEARIGGPLSACRWRLNIWLDGLDPWAEFDWIGRHLRLGGARLEVVERIRRCRATEANPDTGQRDAPTLEVLDQGWGHRDFGIYARVTDGGPVGLGDAIEVIG